MAKLVVRPKALRPNFPTHLQRMRDAVAYEKIRTGSGMEVFLQRATVVSATEIRLNTYPTITTLQTIQATFLKLYFVHLARKLRFDRGESGLPEENHKLYAAAKLPTTAEFRRTLDRLGLDRSRGSAGVRCLTLHLKVPALLDFANESPPDGNLVELLAQLDTINTAEQAKAYWDFDRMRQAEGQKSVQDALLKQVTSNPPVYTQPSFLWPQYYPQQWGLGWPQGWPFPPDSRR